MPPATVPITVTHSDASKLSPIYRAKFMVAARNIRCEIMVITPEWATKILAERNENNRRMTTSWKKIQDSIFRDAWEVNGECIVFDTNGRLVNGQNRLKAVADGGVSIPCMVVYGVAPECFKTYDQGKLRNNRDILSMLGYDNQRHVASALAWQQRYDNGVIDVIHHEPIPNDTINDVAEQYPEICIAVAYMVKHYSLKKQKRIPVPLAAFLWNQFQSRDETACDEFFTKVLGGFGVGPNSHEAILIRRLDGMVGERKGVDQIEIAALCIITWNRIRNGDDAREILVWKANNVGVKTFPVISE